MAFVEENWQTKRLTIKERTTFIFNNELLTDVKFVVPVSTGESHLQVCACHQQSCVLCHALWSIELPDCDYESLLELFRFMYSDEVNLSGSNACL